MDFLCCGQEEGEVAFGAGISPLVPIQGKGVLVRVQCAIPLEVTSVPLACPPSNEQRRPLSLRLLRNGGEFDFSLVCVIEC